MPTILRRNGFEFVIRTRDHEPPHVHVLYAGTEVLFNLGIGDDMPTIREIRGMNRQNVRRAFEIAVENNEMFLARWREIYG
jgi:NADPH-dependent glutamate synthase beta subunit-like oxidoreductase